MSASVLKMLAIFTMIIDHVGSVLYTGTLLQSGLDAAQNLLFMRAVGRIAFPVFAFLIAEGCAHTRSMKKYIARLTVFAVLSEIPYDLFDALHNRSTADALFTFETQNVMFTLALGALAIWFYRKAWMDKPRAALWGFASFGVVVVVSMLVRSEYAPSGVLAIVAAYALRPKEADAPDARVLGRRDVQVVACWLACLTFPLLTRQLQPLQLGILAVPLFLMLYNGKPGPRRGKYLFYAFYPLHLLALACVLYVIHNY